VVAAQKLRADLAGMDADALTDSLTEDAASVGTSSSFRGHLAAVNDQIVAAARNITYGEAEAGPIRALTGDLERYLESLAETRWMARGNTWLAIQRMRWSSRLMNDFALPDAMALEAANLAPLERQYAAYRSVRLALAGAAMGLLLLLVAALIGAQIYLFRRSRRIVNIPLAAATVIALATMAGFAAALWAESADTRAAKEDAFDSIHALYDARALASRLNAERAMWLLDPATRSQTETQFAADARRLLDADPGRAAASAVPLIGRLDVKTTGALTDALQRAQGLEREGDAAGALAATPKLGGALGAELGNVTFGAAERDPATAAVGDLLRYLDVDREVRRLEGAQRHVEAVVLANATGRGGGMAAFDDLDRDIGFTIAVNQREFDRRTRQAIGLLGWLPWATSGALALCLLAAAAGVWQRWREYR
jgi:hypothetical protein